MGVLDQSFDVLVLRYGVQKRIYCKVRQVMSPPHLPHGPTAAVPLSFSPSPASAPSAIRKWGRRRS